MDMSVWCERSCVLKEEEQRIDGNVAAYLQAALTTEGIKEITQNCLTKWEEINSF